MIWLYLWPLVLISILPLYSPPYVLSLFIFIYFYGHYLILNESELPPDSLLCSSFGLTPTWKGRGEPPEELDFWCKAKCTLLARRYIYTSHTIVKNRQNMDITGTFPSVPMCHLTDIISPSPSLLGYYWHVGSDYCKIHLEWMGAQFGMIMAVIHVFWHWPKIKYSLWTNCLPWKATVAWHPCHMWIVWETLTLL